MYSAVVGSRARKKDYARNDVQNRSEEGQLTTIAPASQIGKTNEARSEILDGPVLFVLILDLRPDSYVWPDLACPPPSITFPFSLDMDPAFLRRYPSPLPFALASRQGGQGPRGEIVDCEKVALAQKNGSSQLKRTEIGCALKDHTIALISFI